jgi:hypothetical protein
LVTLDLDVDEEVQIPEVGEQTSRVLVVSWAEVPTSWPDGR